MPSHLSLPKYKIAGRASPSLGITALLVFATAALYVCSSLVERFASLPYTSRGTIWWAAGWAVAMVYLFGPRVLIGVFIGEWITSVMIFGTPIWAGMATGIGNTLEAALGAWILHTGRFDRKMDRKRDIVVLLIAAFLCPLAMLIFQAPTAWIAGWFEKSVRAIDVFAWYANDGLAVLYVVPFACAMAQIREIIESWKQKWIELVLLVLGIGVVTFLAFGTPSGYWFAGLSAAALPFLAWAAFRFEPRTTSIVLVVYSSVIVLCIARRIDPFPGEFPNLFPFLHTLLFVAALLAHLLASVVAERDFAVRRLRHVTRWEGLGTLAGGLAHQLNNQLTVVLGSAELSCQMISETSPAQPLLASVSSSANHMAQLTRNLLAFAGYGVRPQSQPIELKTIIQDAANDVPGPIHVELTREIEDLTIDFDPSLLRMAVRNVITNAIESLISKMGRVNVFVDAVEVEEMKHAWPSEGKPGRYVSIRVIDNGCGMPEDVLKKMFEPFFTTKFMGRGLGLAAVAGVVRQMNGCINVRSQPDHGTTVEILLPYSQFIPREKQPSSAVPAYAED